MIYVVYAVTALYAVLSSAAALVQMKNSQEKIAPIIMLTGSIILITAIILHIMQAPFSQAAAIAGGLAVCAAAFINGKKSGNFHAVHHVIRFIITVLLIIGFILL